MQPILSGRKWNFSIMSIDEASQANVEMLNVNAVAYGLPHRSVSYGATVNLTRMREITQDLAALFGLALPVPPRKAEARR